MGIDSKIFRFLGSIKLAVPLLGTIALILIGATFYESNVGTPTVQNLIYKSPWFGALMFLLAVNLGISTLSRYPWRGARKVGFAITHWGLVVIIAGSAAVIHLSTEGMLLVRTDGGAINQIRVEGELLEVANPDGTQTQRDIFVREDGSVYPEKIGDLSLIGYTDNAVTSVQFQDGGQIDNLAVKVQLQSDRMGQSVERWLAIAPFGYQQTDIGPAHLEIAKATDEQALTELLKEPTSETHEFGLLEIDGKSFDVRDSINQPLNLSNGIKAEVTSVWADFRLDANNKPTSASTQFNNPALQLDLKQGDRQAKWFVFAQPTFEPIRSGDEIELAVNYAPPKLPQTDYFRIVEAPNHQLFYAAASSKGFKSGEFTAGQSVTPGWADFKISLVDRLDKATVQRQVVPVAPVKQGMMAQSGSPALHVATPDGQDFWLPWSEPTDLKTADGDYFAAFTPKILQLPFYVKLNNFIVDRNEGSESVAMWTSKLTLFDAETDSASKRKVWMNHPTWFMGWKLAQASWNPGDLKQSTLQLKREPWWVTGLTWLGSVMVTGGIVSMFYGRAIAKTFRSKSLPDLPEEEEAVKPHIPIFDALTLKKSS
ncbi:cytochrome c biogenesis protein, CcsB-like protein, putative [[Leptolyngbya] sp. PCC 7376]|uniref:cytochrome c biogenesis protein ResB n=1 Tax=[Leptolyngbya] sp. PCC 7376 TaxID=111781 RepID=UPI00029F0261|nr:cytochrome c biogenesis protein ResB [[Leptolyngbya] sp. PCC 7376]AFY39169.1 cytochrome c biogenesis protein, CcsB-like protein, putative [[Leptolyngbya] sp. PCC 7376]